MIVVYNEDKAVQIDMYHFVWADQREGQGYKCDVLIFNNIESIFVADLQNGSPAVPNS